MRVLLSLGIQNRDESICQALIDVPDNMTEEDMYDFVVKYFDRILEYDWEVMDDGR